MIIRILLPILFSVVMLNGVNAQSTQQDTFYRSFGLDASFINNFLPLDNSIGIRGTHLFHFIKFHSNGKFTRHGLDFLLDGSFRKEESALDQNDSRFSLEYKIGLGKRKDIFKKAYLLHGWEFGATYFLNQRKNLDPNNPFEDTYNTNVEQSWSTSVGPMVGFGYNFTKRFSIYTEASFYLRLAYSHEKFKSELTPTSDTEDSALSVKSDFNFPRSIIIFYHF